jgi:hypothetical protein
MEHTEWLGRELEQRIAVLTAAESLALLHYLVGYLNGNEDFKQALELAALEGKL